MMNEHLNMNNFLVIHFCETYKKYKTKSILSILPNLLHIFILKKQYIIYIVEDHFVALPDLITLQLSSKVTTILNLVINIPLQALKLLLSTYLSIYNI